MVALAYPCRLCLSGGNKRSRKRPASYAGNAELSANIGIARLNLVTFDDTLVRSKARNCPQNKVHMTLSKKNDDVASVNNILIDLDHRLS